MDRVREVEFALQPRKQAQARACDRARKEAASSAAEDLASDLALLYPLLANCIRMDAAAWERVIVGARNGSESYRLLLASLVPEIADRAAEIVFAESARAELAADVATLPWEMHHEGICWAGEDVSHPSTVPTSNDGGQL